MSTASPPSTSSNVSLGTAYFLWLFGGIWGLHHAYLGRSHQALLWYGSFGFFGWGWARDGLWLPYYVALARSEPDDPRVKIWNATVQAHKGVPRISVMRMVMMSICGSFFGTMVSCLVVLPDEDEGGDGAWTPNNVVHSVLFGLGAALGVGIIGNIGEETIGGPRWRLVLACLLSSLYASSLGGIIYATWSRMYRPSMAITTEGRGGNHSNNRVAAGPGAAGPAGPGAAAAAASSSSSAAYQRIGRHVLVCAGFTAMLTLSIYNHGGITVNGQRIFAHEAFHNARNSNFWQEFDFEEFRTRGLGGGQDGDGWTEYLEWTMDLEGKRAACRTLGVRVEADFADVKVAYKELARKYHPDKIGADATKEEVEVATAQFLKVQEAYEVLRNIEQQNKSSNSRGEKQNSNKTERKSSERQSQSRDEM